MRVLKILSPQPDRWVACSQYFVRRWLPDLGGTASALVLFLRHYGYYNPVTGECRDEIRGLSETTIARGIGCSAPTLRRLLADHPYIGYFVRVQPDYEITANGRQAQITNVYWIAMFDPVHPEDAALLEEARQIFAEQNKIRPPFKMIGGGDQNDRAARLKMNPPPDQNEQANIRNLSTQESIPKESLPIITHQNVRRSRQEPVRQKTNQQKPTSASPPDDDDDLLRAKHSGETSLNAAQQEAFDTLLGIQIAPATARRLAFSCAPEVVLREIEIDGYRRLPEDGSRGRLIAILEGRARFPVPEAYREAKRRQRRKQQEETTATEAGLPPAEALNTFAALDTLYASLSEEERMAIDEEALSQLPSVLRQRPNSRATQAQLVARRRELLKARFPSSPPPGE